MNIVFNMIKCGLGSNGGTKTILKCSEVLEKLGHRCDIIANVDNFTWFDHKPVIRQIPNDLDAIINVAAVDYELTRKSNVPIKVAWWRGHELWSSKEDYLRYCYTNTEVKNIVNSRGLRWLLASYGADSTVIYPGIDFDLWEDRKLRSKDKIRIGCLYQKKPTKRWKDFVKLAETLGNKDYEYVGFGDTMRKDSFLNKFVRYPTHEELVELYSSCHIFFLPTVSEGLHNVGIEAALCGCLLVGNDNSKNGMSCDYLFDEKTGMVYPSDDINVAAELIRSSNWTLVSKAQKFIVENIGSRETNMKKFVEKLKC